MTRNSRQRRAASRRESVPVTKTIYNEGQTASAPNALLASAQILRADRSLVLHHESWQEEIWRFYETLGEFTYAIDWLAAAMSRMRLRAARKVPGSDEPEFIDDGLPAQLVADLAGGVGGQSAMLQAFTVHLQGPGDSYLIGMDKSDNGGGTERSWGVYSKDVIRVKSGGGFELQVAENAWVRLPEESLVVRIWNADKRFQFRASSSSKSAIGTMQEIELYNRHIMATLVSRLAFNGVWLIPQEVTFPVKEEFAEAPDPFVAELIDIASKSIQNPGSASSAIPIPLKVPSEFIEKFVHLKFADTVDKGITEQREKALVRLSRQLNVPQEVLEGMGNVNHWSAWQIEDTSIKIHLSPIAELICHGLTVGYMKPMLAAAKTLDDAIDAVQDDDNDDILIWYDPSELKQKPDLGEKAIQLHDRMVVSDSALRRGTGFDESDAPTDDEVKQQVIKRLAYNGQQATNAWELLTGTPAPPSPSTSSTAPDDDTDSENLPSEGGAGPSIPDTQDNPPSGDASLLTGVNGADPAVHA